MKLDLNLCVKEGGKSQCRYFGEDETGQHVCHKSQPGVRQAIDTEVDDYLRLTGDSGREPLPLGDNCPGVPLPFKEWLKQHK